MAQFLKFDTSQSHPGDCSQSATRLNIGCIGMYCWNLVIRDPFYAIVLPPRFSSPAFSAMVSMGGRSFAESRNLPELYKDAVSLAAAVKNKTDINSHRKIPLSSSSSMDCSVSEAISSRLPAKMRAVPNPHHVASTDRNGNGLASYPLSKGDQVSTSMDLLEEGSQTTDQQSRDQETYSESHDTPSGSTTSVSPISPLPSGKSPSPSAQLNSALNSVSAAVRRGPEPIPSFYKFRPRSSIPARLPAPVYAQQCVAAAHASRLNPYALHKAEQAILQDHLCHLHVTTYLNIRNGILRLWTRNPMVSVTKEEDIDIGGGYYMNDFVMQKQLCWILNAKCWMLYYSVISFNI